MNIIVTGGAGFIGSHLSERLLDDGHRVMIIDSFDDYYPPSLKRANVADIYWHGSPLVLEQDIGDAGRLADLFQEFSPDAVVHLAARAGVRYSIDEPLLTERVNVAGTVNVLEACRRLKDPPRFVFASSSSVYGACPHVPFREDDCHLSPISPYAATKVAGEALCGVYSRLYGISTACLRVFTVYGPRQRPDLAICKFTAAISRGEKVPLFGSCASARDYTFISDVVEGIVATLAAPMEYEIINIGNSNPVSLSAMILQVERALGRKAILERLPAQPGDPQTTCAEISKARQLLGYCPRGPFSEGIAAFVDWYRRVGVSKQP